MAIDLRSVTRSHLSVHRGAQARMVRMSLYIYEIESVLGQLSSAEYGAVLVALSDARKYLADAQVHMADELRGEHEAPQRPEEGPLSVSAAG